ncbi:MAG: hypothetical protein R3F30_15555 [Planctomycetota bacterium]
MSATSADLPPLLDELERQHGAPGDLPPRTALDWVLWENVAYLVSDERRAEVYAALADLCGLEPERILTTEPARLHELAARGGMQPDRRVGKLLAIAETVLAEHDGDLDAALTLPLAEARRALQRFPGIGRPGADKILLFTGARAVPALESNGLRVLCRLGLVEEAKSYATTYNRAVAVLEAHADRGCAWLRRTHDLLKAHGRTTCRIKAPACADCAISPRCPAAHGA